MRFVLLKHRITSYNVCYTKLLRIRKHFSSPVNAIPAIALFTSQEKNNADFLIANGFNWSVPMNFTIEDLNSTISWISNAEPDTEVVKKSSSDINFEFFRQCSGNDKAFMMDMADLFYKTYPSYNFV